MSTPVILSVVDGGVLHAFYRDSSGDVSPSAQLRVGDAVAPHKLAEIMGDLGDALDWAGIAEPAPPPKAKARALPAAAPKRAPKRAAKRGRPSGDTIAGEIQGVADVVRDHPRGIGMRAMLELVWPDQLYSESLYARAHNRTTRAEQLGLVRIIRDQAGALTVFPVAQVGNGTDNG